MFLCHPSSLWPGKLTKQFRGLCVLGAAETVGIDSRINGFTCCRRTPSHRFTVVTVLHEKVSCSESHTSACAACCSHLTPAHRPNPALQGGQAAHPGGGFGAQKVGSGARTDEPGHLGGAMWTYRKLGHTWGPRCVQWHESVLATESPSSFPAVKMAFCESSTILLIMERSPPDRLLALDSRTVAFHVY